MITIRMKNAPIAHATVFNVLSVMQDHAMLDAQDPGEAQQRAALDTMMQTAHVSVMLRNVSGQSLETHTARNGLIMREHTTPAQPWPIIVKVHVTPLFASGVLGSYTFAKRIPPNAPEQFNALLVALAEINADYLVL